MRQDITSIPVTEVFEPRDGCPICRMRNLLEERVVEYITGAAMMEPDVREETNRQGFCFPHYQMMLKRRNRLGVALILESHLQEVRRQVFESPVPFIKKAPGKQAGSAAKAADSCFVCRQVDWGMERMLATVCRLWENERDFRRLFEEQPTLCLPHFSLLTRAAQTEISKKNLPDFGKACSSLASRYLDELSSDVSHFCRMFDYRNSGEEADWGNSRDSIERAVWWLTSREVK